MQIILFMTWVFYNKNNVLNQMLDADLSSNIHSSLDAPR